MTDFEEIYRTYFNDVFLFIRKLSNDEHIAEEITSEAFFKAMRNIEKFRGDCHIRVWLCQIAKNCYYSYLKKTAKQTVLPDIAILEMPDDGETVEEKLIQSDEVRQIRKLLHDIKDPYKEVFMWRVFAELSFKEIGRMFHRTENWACVTYHRALKMIRERMGDSEHEK